MSFQAVDRLLALRSAGSMAERRYPSHEASACMGAGDDERIENVVRVLLRVSAELQRTKRLVCVCVCVSCGTYFIYQFCVDAMTPRCEKGLAKYCHVFSMSRGKQAMSQWTRARAIFSKPKV